MRRSPLVIPTREAQEHLLCGCTTRYQPVAEIRLGAKLDHESIDFCREQLRVLERRLLVELQQQPCVKRPARYRLTEAGVREKARIRLAAAHPIPVREPDYEEALY